MANGRLAAVTPTANTDTFLYQAPATKTSSVTINICNTAATSSLVRVSIENSSAVGIASTNCIEYDHQIEANGVLERGAIVLDNQQKLFCRSSLAGVNFVVYGYEE